MIVGQECPKDVGKNCPKDVANTILSLFLPVLSLVVSGNSVQPMPITSIAKGGGGGQNEPKMGKEQKRPYT